MDPTKAHLLYLGKQINICERMVVLHSATHLGFGREFGRVEFPTASKG